MRKHHIAAIATTMLMALFFAPHLAGNYGGICAAATAEDSWKRELMDICSKTDEAMSFSKDELKILLQRGEKLRPVIEALEESPRKVYLKRLQMCMNLYSFVLESKGIEKKP